LFGLGPDVPNRTCYAFKWYGKNAKTISCTAGHENYFQCFSQRSVLLSSLYPLSDKLTKSNVIVPKARKYFVLKVSAGTEFPKLSKNLNPVKWSLAHRF
jgi:hypothetical protein